MTRTRSRRGGGAVFFVRVACTALWLAGCATTGGDSDRFESKALGYSVPYLEKMDPAADPSVSSIWKRLRVDDADLAYRGPGDSLLAISARCEEGQTDPALLGRQLLIGLKHRTRLESERFEFAEGMAFAQVVKARQDDVPVHTKTVTWVREGCVVDWVLAAPEFTEELVASFDLWWQGFDPGSMPGASPASEPAGDAAEEAP